MAELPLAPLKRILKRAGGERVSDDAVEALRDEVEDRALEMAQRAREYAKHADRKTVQREDVMAARREH
ncbi:MAG: NFYB/HAP3 family transcription factor subunit [Candidatus Nanohaloarchaeota archaeon QJJ-5]|nr:NFYB/HAP3 family transcription factor subunit [Candidatus Nanohaloarchaeota archaeon QJJ-5]